MQFGTKKTRLTSSMVLVDKFYMGELSVALVQYTERFRLVLGDIEGETAAYLNFANKIRELKEQGRLEFDYEDLGTLPSFIIKYPKEDNGYYQVILNWCEKVVESK